MNDTPEATGPRRYTVKLDVPANVIGTIFSALIDQVEQPQLTQNPEGGHRIVFICTKDQLPTIVSLVNDASDKIFIGPFNPEVKMAPAVYKPPPRLAQVVTPLQREIQRPVLRRQFGGVTRDTGIGQVIMKTFREANRSILHSPDLVDAVAAVGYKGDSASPVLSSLVQEGDLVRIGRGAYRVPTPVEREAWEAKNSPEQSGSTNTDHKAV